MKSSNKKPSRRYNEPKTAKQCRKLKPEQIATGQSIKGEHPNRRRSRRVNVPGTLDPKPKTEHYNMAHNSDEKTKGRLFRYDYFTWRRIPVNEDYVETLAQRLTTWARKPDSIVLTEFLELEGLNRKEMSNFLPRSEKLRLAMEFAKLCIGNHREKGGMNKKLDFKTVNQKQWMYDEDWRKSDTYHAENKAEADKFSQKNVQYVVIDKIEPTKEKA